VEDQGNGLTASASASDGAASAQPVKQIERQKFRLHWWAAGLLLLAFILVPTASLLAGGANEPSIFLPSRLAGSFAAVLLFGAGPGWLTWRLSHRKLAGSIVCTIMCVLVMLGALAQFSLYVQQRHQQRLQTLARQFQSQIVDLNEQQSAGKDTRQAVTDLLEEGVSTLRDHANTAAGNEARVARMTARFLEEVGRMRLSFESALAELMRAGGLRQSTLRTPVDIRSRIVLIDKLLATNQTLAAFMDHVKPYHQQQLVNQGMTAQDAEQTVDALLAPLAEQHALLKQLRQINHTSFSSGKAALQLLLDHEGDWQKEAATGRFLFSDTDTLEKYTQYMSDLGRGSQEEQRVSMQLQELQRELAAKIPRSEP
jgi:hypothetical protein